VKKFDSTGYLQSCVQSIVHGDDQEILRFYAKQQHSVGLYVCS